MTSSIEDLTPEDLLRETAWLNSLAKQLVADPHRAEDVAQEAWLAVAQRRDRVAELRPWLRRIAQNLAARLIVRETQRREREERAARPEAQPSTAESVERVRLQHCVVAAVLRLPEPYRSTVVLRFFEDLPPRKIAARMTVPVETVRTRLQRALARMRRELDREFSDRRAWAVPLASGFGTARTAAPALLVGSIMKAKTLTAATVVLLASGMGYLLLGSGPPPADTSDLTIPHPGASAAGPSSQLIHSFGADASEPRFPDTAAGGRTPIGPVATSVMLIGRCIDVTTRRPVSGVSVAFKPQLPAMPPIDTGVFELPFPSPNQEQTDLDGRFTLVFEAGWTFTLELSGAGIVPMSTLSSPLEPGTTDLGPIEVTRGCIVRGRLVDEDGQPLAEREVRVDRGSSRFDDRIMIERNESDALAALGQFPLPGRISLQNRSRYTATTDPDGQFELPDPVAAETWTVHLWERRRLVPETKLEILASDSVRWIDLIGERERDVLSGVVVNDIGEPIASARVYFAMVNGTEWYLVTGEDGTFRTPSFARDPAGPVRVRATVSGHTSPDPVSREWGSSIEIVLTRGGIVDIYVFDAASGKPVLDYMAMIFRIPGRGGVMTDDAMRLWAGTLESGRYRVSGIQPGRNLVMVEPRSPDLEPSWFEPVDVRSAEISQVEIRVDRAVTRDLRVADQAGRPVAGSHVELIRMPIPGTVKSSTRAFRKPQIKALWDGGSALILLQGSTDQEGRFPLRSAPASGLSLRLLGMEHPTVVVNGIDLEAGMPELLVEVKPGAEIVGVLQPIAPPAVPPTMHLLNADDPADRFFVPVSKDGSFTFTNVPEGSWNLIFSARQLPDSVLMTVESLSAGERRDLGVLDVAHLAPARLRGRVYLDGEPVQGRVRVEAVTIGPGHRYARYAQRNTGVSGAFGLTAPEGRYRLVLEIGSEPERWKSEEIIEVFAGQETDHEFYFSRHRFAAQLVDSDGTPLADRRVEVLWEESTWSAGTLRSDAEGHVVIDPAPPGSFHLGLRPPELATNDAWATHMHEHGAKAFEDLIKVGPLSASGGSRVKLTVSAIRR